jgi:hypothetical protein
MGETDDNSYTRGRLDFMRGVSLYLSLYADAEYARGWLDAFEEFMGKPAGGM